MKRKVLLFSAADQKLEAQVKGLGEHGYNVGTFSYSQFNTQLLQKEQPNLILLNITQKSAPQALQVISEIKGQKFRVGILALSTHANSALAEEAYRKGATAYLFRPFKIKDLIPLLKITEDKVNQEYDCEKVKHDSINLINQFKSILVSTKALGENAAFTKENIRRYGQTILKQFAECFAARDGSIYLIEETELVLIGQLDKNHKRPSSIPLPFDDADTSALKYVLTENELVVVEAINNNKIIRKSGWLGYKDESFIAFPLGSNKSNTAIVALNDSSREPFNLWEKNSGVYNHLMTYATIKISNEIISLLSNDLDLLKRAQGTP